MTRKLSPFIEPMNPSTRCSPSPSSPSRPSRPSRHRLMLPVLLSAALLSACGGGDSSRSAEERVNSIARDVLATTELPEDVTRLYKISGNVASNTVVLFLQGGPVDTLAPADSLDTLGLGLSTQALVQVHQANTYNPAIVGNPDLTETRATLENQVSIEMVDRVIRHFVSQGRRVQVVTHSFGSLLILRTLARHPELHAMVDRFLVLNGRLNIPEVVWQGMRQGQQWRFPGGGAPALAARQPTRESLEGDDDRAPGDPPLTHTYTLSQLKLESDMGRIALTDALAGLRMDRVIMVEASADEAIGRLSDLERRFLADAGATRYCIEGGSHDSAFETPYAQELLALLNGTSTATRTCSI